MSDIGLNSGGRHIYQSAKIDDATGIVLTVASAGTAVALKGAAFASEAVDASGGLLFTVADGDVECIGTKGGAGVYLVELSASDVIGANGAVLLAGIYKNGVLASHKLRAVMPGTAARTDMGCARCIITLADGDDVDARFDSGTNADTVTVRSAHLSLVKIA